MNQLEFTVAGNHLEITEDAVSTGGSVNFDKCVFTFDEDWTGFERTAVFGIGRDTYRVALDEDDSCFIPSPCMEKEGIITIGVFGTDDNDTVIATNAVAHHIEEGIDGLGDWFEEDYSLVLRAVSNMEGRVAECIRNLNNNFDSVMRIIRRDGVLTSETISTDCPDDWYIPNEFSGADNLDDIVLGEDINAFLDYRLNGLCRDFPAYVSREKLGMDESGDYPIYAYYFEPADYEKTVFVTGGIHGMEAMIVIGLSNFFNELCRHSQGDRTLSYLKSRVKFVVIPIVNPYGIATRSINNSNDVDIGYNFPYRWDDCPMTAKGSEEADQTETQLVIDCAELLKTDKLCAAVDFHSGMYTVSGKSIFYPRFKNNCITALSDFVNRFSYDVDSGTKSKGVLAPSILPTLTNYLADEYGINTCEAVWPYELYGGQYDDDNYTKLTEFIGNLLYVMAKNSSFANKFLTEPFVKHISWQGNNDSYVIPSDDDPVKMGISNYSFSLSAPCVINMQGSVTLDVRDDCTLIIYPVLYQENSPEQSYDDLIDSTAFRQKLELTEGTYVVPVSAVLQAYYSSYNHMDRTYFAEDVKFVLAFEISDESAAEVTAFSATFSGYPTNLGKPVEISRPMGTASDYESEDVPTQRLLYPLETVVFSDRKFDD